jgi:hypothetical protein
MRTSHQRMRRRGRIATVVAAAAGLLLGTAAAASAAVAPAKPGGATATGVHLTTEVKSDMLRLYAAYRHIPRSDIARVISGSTRAARAGNGTDWAIARFQVSARAPLSVKVEFQDGASSGIFTKSPRHGWRMRSLGRPLVGCDAAVPAPVRRAWRLGTCPAALRTPTSPTRLKPAATTGTAAEILDLANEYIGVGDTPASTSFADDCNPFTYFENPSASDSGCGIDPTFDVRDHNEEWCADFAKYIWSQAGVTGPLSDLTPAAASFYAYGQAQGESMPTDPPASDAQVGDAIVLYPPGTTPNANSADHVGIVTGVDTSDGEIETVNGDFPWSTSYIEVSQAPYLAPQTFADDAEEDTGENWIFVSPKLPGGTTTSAGGPAAPAIALNPTTSDQDVVFQGANGDVYEDHYNDAQGTWSGVNECTTNNWGCNVGSAPAGSVDDDNNQDVVFQGANGDIYEYHYNNAKGTWSGVDECTTNNWGCSPGSAPAIALNPTTDDQDAVFQGTNGDIYEYHYNNAQGTWSGVNECTTNNWGCSVS